MTDRVALDAQRGHWERTLAESADRFGAGASAPARAAVQAFRTAGASLLLELGAGQGRDTLFFARAGFDVVAVDYADSAVKEIQRKAAEQHLDDRVRVAMHDLRAPLPFADEAFDGCFSHMLYCMALTEHELARLSAEIRRVLRPGALNVYTARTTEDPDYGKGVHHGENLYELGGFVVHFLDADAVQRLAVGFELIDIEKFEEGTLPRRLVRVTLRKPQRPTNPREEASVPEVPHMQHLRPSAEVGAKLDWTAARRPQHTTLHGSHVLLRPVSAAADAETLYAVSHPPEGDPAIWTYLPDGPYESAERLRRMLSWAETSDDPLYFALVRLPDERPLGIASYLRITPEFGVIEIGRIWFGTPLRRTTAASEAIYLLARHAFDELGYRRLEWKCDALNAASRRAAERFGFRFEGIFRNHMVIKGRNRDTAWYAITDYEWPAIRAGFEAWLASENFDREGVQKRRLGELIAAARGEALG